MQVVSNKGCTDWSDEIIMAQEIASHLYCMYINKFVNSPVQEAEVAAPDLAQGLGVGQAPQRSARSCLIQMAPALMW